MAPMGWIFSHPAFYLLAIGSMCSIGAVGGTNQHLKLFLKLDLHYTDQQVANEGSLVLISSLVGRLLMGFLADRFAKKYVMLLIYLLVAAGIPLLFIANSPGVIYLFAIVFGIGLGGDLAEGGEPLQLQQREFNPGRLLRAGRRRPLPCELSQGGEQIVAGGRRRVVWRRVHS